MMRLDAGRSKAHPESKIIAYTWDLDGDGKFETNTGKKSQVRYLMPSTRDVSTTVRVIQADGQTDTDRVLVDVADVTCPRQHVAGRVTIVAQCIRPDGTDRYKVEGTAGAVDGRTTRTIGVNGLGLTAYGTEPFILDRAAGTLTSPHAVNSVVWNTPAGDIQLRSKPAGQFRMNVPRRFTGKAQASIDSALGFHIISFGAGDRCLSVVDTCARVPGDLPIVGQIDLYAANTTTLVVDANVELRQPFTVTAAIRLRIGLNPVGLHLDSLKFQLANADLGFLKIEDEALSTTRRGQAIRRPTRNAGPPG